MSKAYKFWSARTTYAAGDGLRYALAMDSIEQFRRAREQFHKLLDLQAEDRVGALAQLRHDDPDIGAQVTQLFAHFDESDLNAALLGSAQARQIGPFEIIALLGRGGMGEVFEARRMDVDFDQRVALKVVQAPLLNAQSSQRFQRERAILARLSHPNIAHLIEGGIDPGTGCSWFAMELVKGAAITRWCDARKLGIAQVIDLSATPFFLRGSGYAEGTLFPWTMSDFSLMDAIECGIVKLPRVPVADNIPGGEMPMFRNLWEHIRAKMPKKGRGKANALDPLSLPPQLQTALEALYGHYEKTYRLWEEAGIQVPPCFIVVCNNTSTSKLVYDYISGFHRQNDDGSTTLENGRLALFRNFDEHGNPLPRPNTLLIDSEQLESGEGLDDNFRAMASDEIERFRREILERGGQLADELRQGKELDDVTLLREVMNTVGKHGQLGGSIRCVVSVSMLTEGWDANTVTHVLGVRAFGTQLLCEQVIGRALRRQSYDLNEEGLFNVEYADVLGIPFDFTAKPVVAPPQPPRETIQVTAVRPERDALEIRFPRVEGYRVELPEERLSAEFNADSILELTPDLVGATETQNSGIIGEKADLNLVHTGDVRPSQVVYELTSYLVLNKWRDAGEEPKLYLFGQLKRIAKQWLEDYLICTGGTYPAQLKYQMLADMACNRIIAGINRKFVGQRPIKAVLDPYNPIGSTIHVNFTTSKRSRWQTDARRCHINWVILDSDWEAEFCRVVESHPRVRAYVKNHNLGFEVPYRYGSEMRTYLPDFIVLVDDGHGEDNLLHLVVEIKGYRREDAKEKKATMETYWVPGVNDLGHYGRRAFAEFTEVYQIEADFAAKVANQFNRMLQSVTVPAASVGN